MYLREMTHNQIDHILIDGKVYLMSDHSGQQIVVLTTTWWWQKLGRNWQGVNKQRTEHRVYMERFNLKEIN
jgi:hypothetical protein